MESIKFTLYEISGYLLPGLISFMAFVIGYSLINNYEIHVINSTTAIIVISTISYFLGHLNQAFGNFFSGFFEKKILLKRSASISDIKTKLNLDPSLSDKESFSIIMNIAMVKFKTQSMDTFIEREGFYRGTTVGLVLLSISLCISLFFNEIKFINGDNCLHLWQNKKLFFLTISTLSGLLFFIRYLRFLKYRMSLMIDSHN